MDSIGPRDQCSGLNAKDIDPKDEKQYKDQDEKFIRILITNWCICVFLWLFIIVFLSVLQLCILLEEQEVKGGKVRLIHLLSSPPPV